MTDQAMAIKGKQVVLREKRLSDAQRDYAWRCDEELARFDAARPLRSSFPDFLATYGEELRYPSPFRQVFAVEDLKGKHIGNVMYYNINSSRGEAELGITIGEKSYWGKGYGTDALRTLARYIFDSTDLNRVYLNTLDWNIRAQRSFKKAGFVPRGTSRRDGHTFITMELRREQVMTPEPPEGS